jgi:translocation protein SEC63
LPEAIQGFDPYEIMEVTSDTSMSDIKRIYRKKSLLMHPDKNPDDPNANQKFIELTKAYTTLTDEEAFNNYKKFGNPDGRGAMHVAIALPRFLLKKDN